MEKKKFTYWKALGIWCLALAAILVVLLIVFGIFLLRYQSIYDKEQPEQRMVGVIEDIGKNTNSFLNQYLSVPELSEYETEEHLIQVIADYLETDDLSYNKTDGEYLETRPVYTVSSKGQPVLKIYFKKSTELAKFKIAKYEINKVETVISKNESFMIQAPENTTVMVNVLAVNKPEDESLYVKNPASTYLGDYYELDQLVSYVIDGSYGEVEVIAKNERGEVLPVRRLENGNYQVLLGDESLISEEQRTYAQEFVKKYALVMSNDLSNTEMDKYFPNGSKILYSIKHSDTIWYDAHETPEILNEEIKSVTYYGENAFSARVYLDEEMYVPYRKETVVETTDIEVYFYKMDGTYKVTGINFNPTN